MPGLPASIRAAGKPAPLLNDVVQIVGEEVGEFFAEIA
jgi:hypothetical protein